MPEHAANAGRKVVDVERPGDEAVRLVVDHVDVAADAKGDDRRAAGQWLHDRGGQVFLQARHDHHIGGCIEFHEVGIGNEVDQHMRSEGEVLEPAPATEHHQFGVGLVEPLEGRHELVESLAGVAGGVGGPEQDQLLVERQTVLAAGGKAIDQPEEAGVEWLQRLTHAFPKYAWINPEPLGVWQYRQSIAVVQQIMNQRMFPLTLQGLEGAMRLLSK